MRLPFAALCLCFSLIACGGNAAAGRYVLDAEATLKAMPGDVPEMARQMFRGMKAELTLAGGGTFTGEMEMPMSGGKSTIAGSYELAGEKITMRTTRQNDKAHDETMSGTLSAGVLTLRDDAGGKNMMMIMRRQ